jgi:hypothetical protein
MTTALVGCSIPAASLINGVLARPSKGHGSRLVHLGAHALSAINGGATESSSVLFENVGGDGGKYTTNAAIAHYEALAKSYGLPVPSGSCESK